MTDELKKLAYFIVILAIAATLLGLGYYYLIYLPALAHAAPLNLIMDG